MPRRTRRDKKRDSSNDSGDSRGARAGRPPRVEPTGVIRPLPAHLAPAPPETPGTE